MAGNSNSGNRIASNPYKAKCTDSVDPSENSRRISHLIALRKLPAIEMSDPEVIGGRIFEYLELCSENGMKPLIMGFSIAPGIDRSTLYRLINEWHVRREARGNHRVHGIAQKGHGRHRGQLRRRADQREERPGRPDFRNEEHRLARHRRGRTRGEERLPEQAHQRKPRRDSREIPCYGRTTTRAPSPFVEVAEYEELA